MILASRSSRPRPVTQRSHHDHTHIARLRWRHSGPVLVCCLGGPGLWRAPSLASLAGFGRAFQGCVPVSRFCVSGGAFLVLCLFGFAKGSRPAMRASRLRAYYSVLCTSSTFSSSANPQLLTSHATSMPCRANAFSLGATTPSPPPRAALPIAPATHGLNK